MHRRSVEYISFSAHVDYTQNSKFIDEVMPAHLILVHGEANNVSRLRSALKSKFAERKDDIQIYTPKNVEIVKLKFRGERMAKVCHVSLCRPVLMRPGNWCYRRDEARPGIQVRGPTRLERFHVYFPSAVGPARLYGTEHERHHATTAHDRLGDVGSGALASAGHVRQD